MLYFCVYTFAKTDSLMTFCCLLTGTINLYFKIKNKLDKNQSQVWHNTRKKRDKNNAKLKLDLPRFANGQQSLADITHLIGEKYELKASFDKTRNEQKVFTNLLKEISIAVVLLLIPNNRISTLITVCMQYTGMINSILNLMNQNAHAESEYASLHDKLNVAQKNVIKYDQFVFTNHTVIKCDIHRGKFNLTLNGVLVMKPNRAVLIQGFSGSGKTTMLNAIIGLMNDTEGAYVSLDNQFSPGNYCSNLSLMFQGTKHKLSELSISEILRSSDEQLISELMDISQLSPIMDTLKVIAFSNTGKTCAGSIEIPIESSWIYIPVKEAGILSGGEERRLAVVIQLHELITQNKRLLILDEPEQGSDPPAAFELIRSIIERYKSRCMIIIISHLEKFGGFDRNPDTSGIPWDNKIFVSNGVATVH